SVDCEQSHIPSSRGSIMSLLQSWWNRARGQKAHRQNKNTRRSPFRSILRLEHLEGLVMPAIVLPQPDFPQPVSWLSSPSFPSGFDTFDLPANATGSSAATGSPTITEFTRSGGRDESLAITGGSFSIYQSGTAAFGKDTRFVSYGQTSSRDAEEMDA